ncbi:MAG TPA: hypothetical protein DIW47_00875 [Bacteroidetes bacterium]|nr:hypothetical protein [Bacteroidota bacterium]
MLAQAEVKITQNEKLAKVLLDDLPKMSRRELDELYQLATTPTVGEVKGFTNGRILDGIIPFNRYFSWIPWKGKVFEPLTASNGKGINRMEIGNIKRKWYKFATRIIPPLSGNDDVLTLDYSNQGNIWPIRIVRDDLKKLHDGLFLGAVYLKSGKGYKFTLYFALELAEK